jgi:hypothetical protein
MLACVFALKGQSELVITALKQECKVILDVSVKKDVIGRMLKIGVTIVIVSNCDQVPFTTANICIKLHLLCSKLTVEDLKNMELLLVKIL